MDKAEIRSLCRTKRRAVDSTIAASCSEKAALLLRELISKQRVSHVAVYAAFDGELACDMLVEWLKKGNKKIYFPRIHGESLSFDSFHPLDLIVVPGIAFDKRGYRIGFGKGYYDRFLSDYTGIKVGFAYDFQVLESIPHESWDIAMNYIVTEKKVYRI